MRKKYVPFELAKKLKEKGYPQSTSGRFSMVGACYFNNGRLYEDGCIANIEDCFTAPTIFDALMWLLEKHDYYIAVNVDDYGWRFDIVKIPLSAMCCQTLENISRYPFYEQAALAGIEYAVDNLIK